MYRERLWTMRQYAGFGGAAEANARYRFLLEQGGEQVLVLLRISLLQCPVPPAFQTR